MFRSIEESVIKSMVKKIKIDQNLDEITLQHSTSVTIDDIPFFEYNLDLKPMMDIMEAKLLKKLKKNGV